MGQELLRYFPRPLQEKYPEQIVRHRLRREIISTVVTNGMVNRLGITFAHEVKEKTGSGAGDVARGYTIARAVHAMRDMWSAIEALDNQAPAALQAAMLVECGRLIEQTTVWFLRQAGRKLDIEAEIAAYGPGVQQLAGHLPELLPEPDRKLLDERAGGYAEKGVPPELALRVAALPLLVPACDIVRIARAAKRLSVLEVGKAYFSIGARFGFDWLRRAAGHLPSDNAWDKLAVAAIVDDLYGHQSELTARVVDGSADLSAAEAAIDRWVESRRPAVARTEQLLVELQSSSAPDLAMLAVANRQLRAMVAG